MKSKCNRVKGGGFFSFSLFRVCVEPFLPILVHVYVRTWFFTPIIAYIGVKRARVLCAYVRASVRNVYT